MPLCPLGAATGNGRGAAVNELHARANSDSRRTVRGVEDRIRSSRPITGRLPRSEPRWNKTRTWPAFADRTDGKASGDLPARSRIFATPQSRESGEALGAGRAASLLCAYSCPAGSHVPSSHRKQRHTDTQSGNLGRYISGRRRGRKKTVGGEGVARHAAV